MKTSLSRAKPATNTQTSNLNKSIKKENVPLGNVDLNIDGRRTLSKKQMPPKVPCKVQYNVQVNMTQSKIIEAKQGLQLLKRKMNRTGMSRQKIRSQNEKVNENLTALSKTNINQSNNRDKIIVDKKPMIPKSQKLIIKNKEQANNSRKSIASRQIKQLQDERPISHNNNFMALLERQMKKQGSLPNNQNINKQGKQSNKIIDQNGVQIILQQCSKGCGRMFKPQTISRHQKVCETVFQKKRKQFNSAIHRQIQAQNFKPPAIAAKDAQPKKGKNQIPKWKLESAAFRAGLKMGKNQALTREQQKMVQLAQQDLIACQFCGRKFNQAASKKHLPFCQKKSKEISKQKARKR